IPLNGVDPNLIHLGTKSGSRKVFKEAGVNYPLGMEDLRTEHEVEQALLELKGKRPQLRRAVVKLNDSFSGEGNAIFRYPQEEGVDPLKEAMFFFEYTATTETKD